MWQVFIGWDPELQEAAEVCHHSLIKHSTVPVNVTFLRQQDLQDAKQLWRRDSEATTQTTLSRFLVPFLSSYSGWSLYVDPDYVFTHDLRSLLQSQDSKFAVQVVKVDFKPSIGTKRNGKPQHLYSRKCWSSLMLFNNQHSKCKLLTPELVNTVDPLHLHTMTWAADNEIGGLDTEWQVIPGHTPVPTQPRAIHYTEGGPWIDSARDVPYGWYYARAKQDLIDSKASAPMPGQFDAVPREINELFKKIINYRHDPAGEYYAECGYKTITRNLAMLDNKVCVAVDTDDNDIDKAKLESKGNNYDPFLKSFVIGCGGQITNWEKISESMTPVVFRGVTKFKHMTKCKLVGRDFYYVDTGYFGNPRRKTFHRITKNEMQYLGPVQDRPRDRLQATGWTPRKFHGGSNILLAPSSQKLLKCYDLDLDKWIEDTINQLRLYTDREIIVRHKASRSMRQTSDTMEMALERNVHCLVTFSSIAAVEAVSLGKPAIVLGPSAAAPVTSSQLKDIENLYIPTMDEVEAWLANLAYHQFTEVEMRDGTAWSILNQSS